MKFILPLKNKNIFATENNFRLGIISYDYSREQLILNENTFVKNFNEKNHTKNSKRDRWSTTTQESDYSKRSKFSVFFSKAQYMDA